MAKVLLVDDCTLITTVYTDFLLSRGHEVESSNSSFGVTSLVARHSPDVILMDLNLPGLSGQGILKLLNGKGDYRIIIISGNQEEGSLKSLTDEGLADDYFIKGQPIDNLEIKIRKLLGSPGEDYSCRRVT